MSPIRVGLIGLSTSSDATNWAAQAHLPYLQSEQGKAHYAIKALCNSSVESAQKSIKHYKLDDNVKAYGSPDDLANDSDIDLVVCVVGVQSHYNLIMPSVKAGKNVYTELPLASNMKDMKELANTAEEKGIKTVFGMQGHTSPVVNVVKKILGEGKIGKVLSTTYTGAAGPLGEKPVPVGLKYLGDRDEGGNLMTVWFLHSFNCLLDVFGELEAFSSILGIQRPELEIMDPKQDGKIVDSIKKTAPDHIQLQGRFQSGPLVTYHLRGGDPFPGEPGCRWTVYGETGEIQITNGMALMDMMNGEMQVKVHEFGQKEVQSVELPKDGMTDLQHPSQNVGRIYEAYAKGEGYPDWKLAMKRHELMEEMFKRSDGERAYGEKAGYLK